MSRLEALRNKLHLVWEKGSSDEILRASQELDVEIVKHMKSSRVSQRNPLCDKKHLCRQLMVKGACEHG